MSGLVQDSSAASSPAQGRQRGVPPSGERKRVGSPADTDPPLADAGLVDEAEHGPASVQQPDQGAEQGPSGDEGAGAVDRVEHPEPLRLRPLGAELLAQDAVLREALAEQAAHRLLGGAVGLGHRGGVALRLDQQRAAEQRADDRAGEVRRRFRRGERALGQSHGACYGLGALGEMLLR